MGPVGILVDILASLNISTIRWQILVITYGIICLVEQFSRKSPSLRSGANMSINNGRHLLYICLLSSISKRFQGTS